MALEVQGLTAGYGPVTVLRGVATFESRSGNRVSVMSLSRWERGLSAEAMETLKMESKRIRLMIFMGSSDPAHVFVYNDNITSKQCVSI